MKHANIAYEKEIKIKNERYWVFKFFFHYLSPNVAAHGNNTTIRAHIPRTRIPRYITKARKHRIHLCAEHYYYFELHTIFTYPSRPITPSIGRYLVCNHFNRDCAECPTA